MTVGGRVGAVMKPKSLWERIRSRFLWVTPNDLERLVSKPMADNAKTLDDILQDVADEKTVVESVSTMVDGLSAQLKAALAANDPAKIQQVIDAIDANKAKLAAALVANTPAAVAQAGSGQ